MSFPQRPRLRVHWVSGIIAAALAGAVEAGVVALRARGQSADPGAQALGMVHLVAMYLPLGMAVGAFVGLSLRVLWAAPWFQGIARQWDRGLFRRDEDAFAAGVSFAAALGFFVVTTRAAAEHFATRYHDPVLAAWAMGAAAVGLGVLAVVLAAYVSAAAQPVARFFGPVAQPGTVLIAGVLAVVVALGWVLVQSPRLLHVLDWVSILWFPTLAGIYLVTVAAIRWVAKRRPVVVSPKVSLGLSIVGILAFAWSAWTYGSSNHVRAVVERRSAGGQRLVRFYAARFDRDGDGHSAVFGGGDCDDSNAKIFPGAEDKPGDGIDGDCFDGDARTIEDRKTDGAYGQVPEDSRRPNILLIGIDALRPDHLGVFGYKRRTSPEIDAFAAGAVRFEDTVAQSSRSLRSIPALFTGKNPSEIAYGSEYLYPAFEASNRTVIEELQSSGYASTVVVGTNYFSRIRDFFQGFGKVIQHDDYQAPRDYVVDQGIRQLDVLRRGNKPWVLWLHLFNVHEPYLQDGENSEFGKRPVDKYDTEIRLADREVGRLLKALATRGLDKDTVVILFSDHGEAFGEHGHTGHSTTLYEEEIRSTLLVRAPGFTPKTVTETVALYDLAPTLLNLADRPMPEPTAARSLIPVMLAGDATGVDGAGGADRQFISELLPDGMFPFDQKAIRVGDDKLIWWVRDGLVQLFDLATDPVEKHDLSDANPAKAKEILGDLRNWVAQSARNDLRHGMVVAKHRLKAPPKTVKYPLDVNYGAFTILGYDMPKREFRRGDRISMTFYYRVEEETRKNYFFSLDLVGPGNYRVHDFHAYHYPVNGHYPTTQWKTGEIIEDPVEIIVPDTVRVPVTMEVNLSVLHRRQRTPFHPDPKGLGVLPLGEIRIR